MTFEKENLLEDGEEMIEKVRKHWIIYVKDFCLHTFGCFFFIYIASFLASKGNINGLYYGDYGAMILVSFVLLFWTSFFFAWTKNYFDVWYVTDQHIIAVNQKDIFDRDEAFMELIRIQDVFFEKTTFLSTILGYGKLRVQSAGTEQEFIIEDVRDVEGCAHRIMDLRDRAQGKGKKLADGV